MTAYGFSEQLPEVFPSQIVVDITEVCNLACRHCPHPAFKQSEHYARRYLDPALNAKMVDEVRDFGQGFTQYIRYTSNGEPLIHPHGYEMIDYAVQNSGVFVTITTNGTILDEKRTRRLLDSGVHMIDISIDAHTPKTYAQVRVNGDLEVTRGNVLRLLRWVRESGGTTKVVVSFVEQPANQHETREFESYWREQGAAYVVIRRLHSSSGALADVARQMHSAAAGETRYPCLYPWERITLNPMGSLSFCPTDWVHGSVISGSDYATTTIREVWCGEFLRRLREAHLANDFACHQFCGQCPDWRQTRWPGEGRGYADLVRELKEESGDG